jgi:hypothetical protein
MIKLIKRFLFGEMVKGEKISTPKNFPIRELNHFEMESWAKMVNFGRLYERRIIYIEY